MPGVLEGGAQLLQSEGSTGEAPAGSPEGLQAEGCRLVQHVKKPQLCPTYCKNGVSIYWRKVITRVLIGGSGVGLVRNKVSFASENYFFFLN